MSLTLIVELGMGQQEAFFKFLPNNYKVLAQDSLTNGGAYRITVEYATREMVLDEFRNATFAHRFLGFLPEKSSK